MFNDFQFQPLLPNQLSRLGPGSACGDVDGDGNPDLIIAQNFFSPQPETGRMDGGLSQLLAGNGDGTFKAIPASKSGLVVPGDAASLTLSDHDGDNLPDLTFGINSGPVASYQGTNQKTLAVHLPRVPGTRVTLNGQCPEFYFGTRYFSQSAPVLFFASAVTDTNLTIRWPDGSTSSQEIQTGESSVTIEAVAK